MIWDKILPISPEGCRGSGERAGAGDRGGDTAESEHGGGGGGSGGGQLYSSPILVSYYLFLTDNTYITVCY